MVPGLGLLLAPLRKPAAQGPRRPIRVAGQHDVGPDKPVRVTAVGERQDAWLRLENLYRAARDEVYEYVATLLHDAAAAEDVTALAFARA